MQNRCFSLSALLIVAIQTQPCFANDPVPGPPTWIVDVQVITDGPSGLSQLTGTVFNWHETRQAWTRAGAIQQGDRAFDPSRSRSRTVLILQSDQFAASMNTLRFSRLDGSAIESDDIPGLLKTKRAVAFLPKGTGIHPAIVATLHPETIVVTRVSYPSDPIVIPIPERR